MGYNDQTACNSMNHTPEYLAHLKSPAWKLIRKSALQRARGQCQKCGKYTPRLEVHHKHYRNLGAEPPEDLIALCSDCHAFEDKIRAMETAKRNLENSATNIYEAALDTYMSKVYGENYDLTPARLAKFDRWYESKLDND